MIGKIGIIIKVKVKVTRTMSFLLYLKAVEKSVIHSNVNITNKVLL